MRMRKGLIVMILAAALILSSCGAGSAAGGEEQPNQEYESGEAQYDSSSEIGYTNDYSYEYATEHPAYLEENETDATEINCWGDSITEGYGSDGLTYPDVLEELTGIPVRNLGIGGEDSVDILKRSAAYGSQEEDILVIQMGDNGGWINLGQLIRQYRKLISKAGTDRLIT